MAISPAEMPFLWPVPCSDYLLGPEMRGLRGMLTGRSSGLDSTLEPYRFMVRERIFYAHFASDSGAGINAYEEITAVGDLIKAVDNLSTLYGNRMREVSPQHGGAWVMVGVVIGMFADAFANPPERPFQRPASDAPYRGDHTILVHGREGDDFVFTHNWDGWQRESTISVDYLRNHMVEAYIELSPIAPPEGTNWFPAVATSYIPIAQTDDISYGWTKLSTDDAEVTLWGRRTLASNLRDRILQVIAVAPSLCDVDWPPREDDERWLGKPVIVGWALFKVGAHYVSFEEIFVHPEYRERGVARSIIWAAVFNLIILFGPYEIMQIRASDADEFIDRECVNSPVRPRWLPAVGKRVSPNVTERVQLLEMMQRLAVLYGAYTQAEEHRKILRDEPVAGSNRPRR